MPTAGTRLKQLSLEKRELLDRIRASRNAIPRAARSGPLPLSFAQRRLWFVDRLEPGSIVYNVPLAVRLKGRLDSDAFGRAFAEVLRRHEVLRTHFEERGGEPVQVIDPFPAWTEAPRQLERTDLCGLPEPDRGAAVIRLARQEASTPFDLARGPLVRARLLITGEEEHVFLITMHHIVADGWSGGLVMRELGALYEAFSKGRPSPLAEPSIQYVDYAVWQRSTLDGAALEAQLEYWRKQLQGILVLELPLDRPRPAVPSRRGATVPVFIPAAIADPLRKLCRDEGLTLFMALLASFQAVLSRWTGQPDIAIGTTVANRPRAELEKLVGFFVNQLVLRTSLEGDPTVRELLRRVREVCLRAYSHQDLPFERLVEELNPGRSLAHAPLFQVMFLLQNAPEATMSLRKLRLEPLEMPVQVASLDFSVLVAEAADGIEGVIQFATDLFDAPTIQRLAAHWVRALGGFVAAPDAPVSLLDILPEAERRTVIEEWNRTAADCSRQTALHHAFEAQAEEQPDRVALVDEQSQISYAELNVRANQLAWKLISQGAGPEARVAVCLERCPDLVIALLAIEKAGAAYVPLDPEYPDDRLAFMLEDARPAVLLTHRNLRGRLAGVGPRVELDTERTSIDALPRSNPQVALDGNNAAYAIYTSGSTGKPKGAINTHRGIVNRLEWMQRAYELSPGDRVLQKTTFSFDVSVWEFFWPLGSGAALVLAAAGRQGDPEYLVDAIQRHQITVLHFVPSMLSSFVSQPGVTGCRTLRHAISSGEALGTDLAARFGRVSAARLHNLYGPTEASVDVTYWECGGTESGAVVPIGRPIANTQIYVLDGECTPAPIGVPGELYIAGSGLARGYLNRPALTAERFVPNPYRRGERLYRTGDLARWRPDGVLEFLGRADHQVKLRGFRIEPGDIESALREQDGVREAAVVLREDIPGDPRLVCYLVTDGAVWDISRLRTSLAAKLPRYAIPSHFIRLARLPLTPNGKLDRQALPPPARDESRPQQPGNSPRTPVEETLASLWTEVLGVGHAGIHDNFFELGGHSLLLTQLASKIRASFGLDVSLRRLFDLPTIAEMAEELARLSLEQMGEEPGAELLDELSRLSPEEVRILLQQERAL